MHRVDCYSLSFFPCSRNTPFLFACFRILESSCIFTRFKYYILFLIILQLSPYSTLRFVVIVASFSSNDFIFFPNGERMESPNIGLDNKNGLELEPDRDNDGFGRGNEAVDESNLSKFIVIECSRANKMWSSQILQMFICFSIFTSYWGTPAHACSTEVVMGIAVGRNEGQYKCPHCDQHFVEWHSSRGHLTKSHKNNG